MTQTKATETKQMTIGGLAEILLKKGLDGKAVLKGIKRVFPTGNTTMKCVYYYASNLGIKLRKGAEADSGELEALMAELGGAKVRKSTKKVKAA